MSEPIRGGASVARANALIGIAMALSADRSLPGRPYRDVRISIGTVADGAFDAGLTFATGSPDIAYAVARGEIDVAALNPTAYLNMACRGTGPYAEALPLCALAVMPSWDRMAFAVSERTGLRTFEDIKTRQYPLKMSIRRSLAHATRFLIDRVLEAEGLSLAAIESWGGSIQYVDTPSEESRLQEIGAGTVEAVFDEGIKGWGEIALQAGMRFLPLGERSETALRTMGWPLGPIPVSRFPGLDHEILAPSFSGWPIVTRTHLPEEAGYRICAALEGCLAAVAFDADEEVSLADVCRETDATALQAPLHEGAARFYREKGVLR